MRKALPGEESREPGAQAAPQRLGRGAGWRFRNCQVPSRLSSPHSGEGRSRLQVLGPSREPEAKRGWQRDK